MTISIVATPGSASANSFVTEDEMTAYCEARLNAAIWTGAAAQLPALVEATRDITVLNFLGTTVAAAQVLAWPRAWVENPDAPSIVYIGNVSLIYFANDEIPVRVKNATCELALQLLKAGSVDLVSADPLTGVIEKTVDVLTTKWASPQSRLSGLARFPRVIALLSPLFASTTGTLSLERV